jgi:hypothetical protein
MVDVVMREEVEVVDGENHSFVSSPWLKSSNEIWRNSLTRN